MFLDDVLFIQMSSFGTDDWFLRNLSRNCSRKQEKVRTCGYDGPLQNAIDQGMKEYLLAQNMISLILYNPKEGTKVTADVEMHQANRRRVSKLVNLKSFFFLLVLGAHVPPEFPSSGEVSPTFLSQFHLILRCIHEFFQLFTVVIVSILSQKIRKFRNNHRLTHKNDYNHD